MRAHRRILVTAVIPCLCGFAGCARQESTRFEMLRFRFKDADVGRLPAGWRITQTAATGAPAAWEVIRDESAGSGRKVLALVRSENRGGTFNLAIAEKTSFRDLDLTVQVKAVRGKEDQGGGPIWRCQDENNYYICRVNPLEKNYRVYKVTDGRRKQLASADLELEAGRWYTLRVTMVGDRIVCYLDGRKMLETTDGNLPGPGRIGLWTKADAVTSFDDLAARPTGAAVASR